jgi:hypothetical protein
LEIPHFGRGKEVKNCIKKLIAALHGGFLWMEQPISIDLEMIALITRLSSMGENPTKYLDDKTKEKTLAEEMKRTYETESFLCNIIIKRISDVTTWMATKILVCKMLRKCHKEEFLVRVVAAAAQCANGTSLSSTPYLLNLFLEDCKDVHYLGTEFQYLWLLMLITLMGWTESP